MRIQLDGVAEGPEAGRARGRERCFTVLGQVWGRVGGEIWQRRSEGSRLVWEPVVEAMAAGRAVG